MSSARLSIPLQQTASAGDEDSFADEIDKGFLIERAFKQLECFAHAQMNDGVQAFRARFPCPANPESSFNTTVSPGRQFPRMTLPSSIFSFSARAIGMRNPIEISLVM